jgi:hypothetical protein
MCDIPWCSTSRKDIRIMFFANFIFQLYKPWLCVVRSEYNSGKTIGKQQEQCWKYRQHAHSSRFGFQFIQLNLQYRQMYGLCASVLMPVLLQRTDTCILACPRTLIDTKTSLTASCNAVAEAKSLGAKLATMMSTSLPSMHQQVLRRMSKCVTGVKGYTSDTASTQNHDRWQRCIHTA